MKLTMTTVLVSMLLGASLVFRRTSRRVQAEAELWADATDAIH